MRSNLKTDQEVIDEVNAMWAEHKNLTRNLIRNKVKVSDERLKRMHEEGLLVYPPKTIKSNRAMYIRNDKWRNFKLPGSR